MTGVQLFLDEFQQSVQFLGGQNDHDNLFRQQADLLVLLLHFKFLCAVLHTAAQHLIYRHAGDVEFSQRLFQRLDLGNTGDDLNSG